MEATFRCQESHIASQGHPQQRENNRCIGAHSPVVCLIFGHLCPGPTYVIRTLTSEGARNFAMKYATRLEIVPPESMISSNAIATWRKWKKRLENDNSIEIQHGIQDTVGCVSWASEEDMAAGVSRYDLYLHSYQFSHCISVEAYSSNILGEWERCDLFRLHIHL